MSEGAAIPASVPKGDDAIRVRAAVKSDVGLVRTENQDYALVTNAAEETTASGRLLLVADGMGGHRGGATASRLAATTIKDELLSGAGSDLALALRSAFHAANAAIHSEATTNADVRGMGTTCSALVVRGRSGYVAHVGDSRIYAVRNGEIRQVTEDHSLVASMVREGLLTSKEAEVHPRRNVLQRSMGVADQVEVDVLPPLELEIGDLFILCSDGLHGLVREPEILEVVSSHSVERAVQELVRLALERGAPDNVSVIVAKIEDAASAEPEESSAAHTETQKIMRVTESEAPAPRAARGSGWLFGLLLLIAAGAMVVAYLLGYRLDVAALRRFFGAS